MSLAVRDADIGGKVGGEDEGIEYGFGIIDAASVTESVGTVDEIKITSRIGRLVAVRPPVLFRIPVRRVRVGPLCHLASPSSFPFLSNQRHFYPTSVIFIQPASRSSTELPKQGIPSDCLKSRLLVPSTTFLDHMVAATWVHPLVKLVPDLFLCMIYAQSVRTRALYHR